MILHAVNRFFHRHRAFVAWRVTLPLSVGVLAPGPAFSAEKTPLPGARMHIGEELGVTTFTTPGIEIVLRALQDLTPVPYDEVAWALPEQNPPDRARLAFSTGGVIADGFLAVVAQKQSRIEPVGRVLLRQARGLGVGEHVARHSKSIIEKAVAKDWPGIRAALIGTQRDVEQGMMALRNGENAHLVALGGWWRGLEITAGILSGHYSSERAEMLIQPGVPDYFTERLSTMNPSFKKSKLWAALSANLRQVRKLAVKESGAAPSADEVKAIRDLARLTNDLFAVPGE
jgi:hypothetical protein